ncbi:probable transcription repressor OFP9 [Sorghum bicolor]|nr:probable transcription repressor OFP9 [Sorghum bicolor]|eukprot:XP_021319678.1 probable transcription repressor OFP9 [Sorghum bicolor]
MQLFSGRSKQEHNKVGGGGKCHAVAGGTTTRHSKGGGKCRALCCGASRLSVSSSSASCSSADAAPEPLPLPPPAQPRGLSRLAHGMVQARLQSMIDAAAAETGGRPPAARRQPDELSAERHRRRGLPRAWAHGGGGGCCYEKSVVREQAAATRRTCVVLLAEDRRTHDPREEFRRSIAEVIAAKRMAEPAELRALLNCYVSVNAREHRAAILQAFHEVCSALFSCKQLG